MRSTGTRFALAKLFFAFGHAHTYLSAFAYLTPKSVINAFLNGQFVPQLRPRRPLSTKKKNPNDGVLFFVGGASLT